MNQLVNSITVCNAARVMLYCCALTGASLIALEPQPGKPESGIFVESEPAGATIFLNRKLLGVTPLRVSKIPKGIYSLEFEKDGYESRTRKIEVGTNSERVSEKLQAEPIGKLIVEIEPKGSEVLLNGDVVGYTPLVLERLKTGSYSLVVRKPNYESYSREISVTKADPLNFSGFSLRDNILEMFENQVRAEPQRVANYLDLGRYLFLKGERAKALETFKKGQDVSAKPLDFDGAGYSGRANLTAADMEAEKRQRAYDVKCLNSEMQKPRYR